MGVHVIRVPDLGEGIAEVELVAWHVQPGETIAEDQGLADVMTDKASVEIPSPVAGKVLALGGDVGQMLAVGSELIRIDTEAASAASLPAADPASGAATTQREDVRQHTVGAVAAAPAASPSPAPPAVAPSPALPTAGARAPARPRAIASPAVRARAWELGVDLAEVPASGTGGRVTQADLDAHAARTPRTGARAAMAMRPSPQPSGDATEAIRVVGLRRRIAQKMQESKRRIPHFTYVEELDVTEIESLRAHLNERAGSARVHLTLLPFLVRAMVLAVRDFPMVNARFDDEAGVVTRHRAVHVGIATQTPAGLVVPVLRDAQAHDLWSAAAEIARLADTARSGKAVRDELSGSTITITSLGKLGGIASTPVINHPEVAIVGVNRVALRPAVRDGAIVARQLMNLSSSFDHRVVDGADAAAFVRRVRELIENPATLFVE